MSKPPDQEDMFLDEDALIQLAMRELRGKRPPEQKSAAGMPMRSAGVITKLQRELDGRGWTYRDLALNAGLTSTEAQALARGGQRMTRDVAQRLAKIFATSTDYWLREED